MAAEEIDTGTTDLLASVDDGATTGETHPGLQLQMGLLFQGRIFEEVLMNEPVFVLITYLLGKSCVLSSVASHLKGPGGGN